MRQSNHSQAVKFPGYDQICHDPHDDEDWIRCGLCEQWWCGKQLCILK